MTKYLALVGAPLLIVLGNALHPRVDPGSATALLDAVAASPGRWLAAKLLYAAGCLLLIPALAILMRLRPGGVIRAGAVLAGAGAGLNALSQSLTGYTAYAIVERGVDRVAGAELLLAYDDLGAAGLPVSYLSVPVLLVGLLIVGGGLLVTRRAPRPAAILLLAGTVAAGLLQAGPLALAAGAPLIAAFVMLARAVPPAEPAGPESADLESATAATA